MSKNGSQNLMLSTPDVLKAVKEIDQPGTAKLMIDPDGTVRLEANSNFPIPGTQDKQKLFAACTDDGQTNVYYSPSGNPSEVYLLKPTAKSAGKQLIATSESINIKASTVERKATLQSDPIVMSMIGQNTVVATTQKPSSSILSKSLVQDIPAILPPPSVCSLSTSTLSSTIDSPVDDSDFPVDLPVSFETDIKDSGLNSDIDELDSLLPDIGSTIAAHLQTKDFQQDTNAQIENVVKKLLTSKTPVAMTHTMMANNNSVEMPVSYKNIASKHLNVPTINSDGKLLLLTTSTGKNRCIFVSENQKLPLVVPEIAKSIPIMVTHSGFQPTMNALSLHQPSVIPARPTLSSVKPHNAVSLLRAPVRQKTVPRSLPLGNHMQTTPSPTKQPTSVPVIVMPKFTPVISNTMATNKIQQTHVPVKILAKSTGSVCKSGLRFVNSTTTCNRAERSTNPESAEVGNTAASECLKQVVADAIGSKPKMSCKESVVCENVNNNNNQNDGAKETEDTSCKIRIESVFSLSEPSQTSGQSVEKTKKDSKRKRKNANKDKKFKFVTEVKEYTCKPLFVVLERLALSKNSINIHDDTLLKTKCTDYCRKRTLNCLCNIDLLDCKNPALSSKAKYMQRRRIEVTPYPHTKVARHLSDSDVKSRCVDDWTFVEEVPKETATTGKIQNARLLADHSSYTSSTKKYSNDTKYGNKNKLFPTNVTMSCSTIHSTQKAVVGALKDAMTPSADQRNTAGIKSLAPNMKTVKIPATSSSTKQLSTSNVAGTISSTTTTNSSTTTLVSKRPPTASSLNSSIQAPTKHDIMNGKFFLVVIDGKNVLIPTDKSLSNKAFVLQQAADGTTGLVPACLSYNKITSTPPKTTASQRITSINTNNSIMNIRSIVQRADSSVSTVPSSTITTVTYNPAGSTLPQTIESQSRLPTIAFGNVSKPQAVPLATTLNTLATSDTKTKSSNYLQTTCTITCSSTETPSPAIDSTKKRKKTLAERYPLPPGVIIKQEPRTMGYGDEPKEQEVIKSVKPSVPATGNRRLVQSILRPSIVPRLVTSSALAIHTQSTTTVNSRSLIRNTAPIQNIGNINKSVAVPTNIRTLNVTSTPTAQRPVTQTTHPRQPINIIKHFPVSQSASLSTHSLTVAPSVMKNNIITFVKLPNSNVFQSTTSNIPNKTTNEYKTPMSACEFSVPVLISRETSVGNKTVEKNISPPVSPGPPDLGEPQIILPPKLTRRSSNDSDTDSVNSGSHSLPITSSPMPEKSKEESKAKTPQELRIEKLKEQLREQERALEEMRKKKALECPIDIDDDD